MDEVAKPQKKETVTKPPPESLIHATGREVIGSLPAVGATVGGVAGAAGGPVTAAVGAGVGAGAGEAVRQTLLNWFPSFGQAPKDATQALEETGKQMLLGGATEATGPYIDNLFKMAAPALKNSAQKSLLAVMGPTDKYAKGHALEASEQLLQGPAFGEKGYVSRSRKALEKKAETNISRVGKQIDIAESPIAKNIIDPALVAELDRSLDAYDNAMYMPAQTPVGGNPTIQPKYGHEPNIQALSNIRQHLNNEMSNGTISRESLRLVRQNVDKAVQRSEGFARGALISGGAVEPALASKIEVEKDAGNIFRKILNKDRPDIAALNAEYHLWNNVKDAMSPATLNKQFSKEQSPWQQLWHDRYAVWMGRAAGAGALGTAAHYGGEKVGEAAAATGALFAINQLMRSTAWRTVSAATKSQLADMLAKGQLENAAKLATRTALQRNATLPPPIQKDLKQKTVKMRAPDGISTQEVPSDQVDHYKSLGASVVQ